MNFPPQRILVLASIPPLAGTAWLASRSNPANTQTRPLHPPAPAGASSSSPRQVPAPPDRARTMRGFSLIELLVVMAILGLLAAFAIPGFQSMVSSQGVGAAGNEIVASMESARMEAVARQSPVWLGFATRTNAGKLELLVVAFQSRDGSTNFLAANLLPLGRVSKLPGITLRPCAELRSELRALLEPARVALLADLSTSTNGAAITQAGVTFSRTITFTPRGEATLAGSPSSTDGFNPFIGLGLRQARGTNVPANAQEIAVVLDGSIAQPSIIRIE